MRLLSLSLFPFFHSHPPTHSPNHKSRTLSPRPQTVKEWAWQEVARELKPLADLIERLQACLPPKHPKPLQFFFTISQPWLSVLLGLNPKPQMPILLCY